MPDGGLGAIQGQVQVALAGAVGDRRTEIFDFDFARANIVEVGKCAAIRGDTPLGKGLAASKFRDGQRIQAQNGRVCGSAAFEYTQVVGPFPISGCGDFQVRGARRRRGAVGRRVMGRRVMGRHLRARAEA